MLKPTLGKGGGEPKTSIDYLREQNFRDEKKVGFELFMSTLPSIKFLVECMGLGRNIPQEMEQEIRKALRTYLKSCVRKVNWEIEGKAILDFVCQVDWKHDFILTFNCDLLLETAAKRLGLDVVDRIIHLHGSISERTLAWPTYTKFAYRTTKAPLAPRWNKAIEILRSQAGRDRLVFIGYSMPPSDLEAKSLFNYTDWYNRLEGNLYSYPIVVVNPCKTKAFKENYKFFRKDPVFLPLTLEKWMKKLS